MATAVIPADGQLKVGSSAPRRRFRLLDGMILVAAMAVACAITQWIDFATGGAISWSSIPKTIAQRGAGYNNLIEVSVLVLVLSLPFASMSSLAVIPFRLIGPRPRFRRLAQQPGMTAMCAATIALLIATIGNFVTATTGRGSLLAVDPIFAVHLFVAYPGMAVLGAWVSLLLAGRWRGERGWIDRLGRVLGFFWISVGILISLLILWAKGW